MLRAMASQAADNTALAADYAGPEDQHTFSYPLPANTNLDSTKNVTEFLVKLRESTIQMQKDVNAFLTQKMDEDKAKDSAQNGTKVDEDKEEDMYGEEADDED